MLKIIPLGGLGEIGLNMMAFEYNESIIVVDAGLMFPEDYMLGVDIVIPDMEYLKQNRSKIYGIILTHGHEDHIGALPYLIKEIKAPVYGTPFTIALAKHKLEEHELLSSVKLNEIFPRGKLVIKDFDIEFIRVGHSVVDGVGLAIKTPLGTIIHTGDFKIDNTADEKAMTDIRRFAHFGEEGVLALLSDSTNVEREGHTISAEEIRDRLEKIIKNAKGRVIVALFASNINRIQRIINIAKEKKCKVSFSGKSIEICVNIAKSLGYLHIPHGMEIPMEHISKFRDEEILMITTGTQGEPLSALARMASGNHKHIKIKEGDTVILSSKIIPGNERAIAKIINNLFKRKADVIYERISEIHLSGHAFQEELKFMIKLTKPKYFIPIHGEYRHLIHHAKIAENLSIPKENILVAENGQVIGFDDNNGKIIDSVLTGRVLVDGKGVGDVGRSVLKERRALSEEGIVAVTMAFDEKTGIVVYGPEIDSRGFVFSSEKGYLLEDAKCVILEVVDEIEPNVSDRIEKITAKIKTSLSRYFYFVIKRKPVILPFIMEL
ncbi:MAG: ribonuclease J [Desulfobacterales bacterium]|nr:ribonuclease J [Desulfobacterales bacterium]MBF0395514.1 ribonuclease J [Desulfobacterales bacterium]